MNSKDKGDVSEAMVLAALVSSGKSVLMPFGDNKRYDMAIDDNGKLIRIQVKTGRLRNGVVMANTCSCGARVGARQGYAGQAEVIAIYCPDTKTVYFLPVGEVGNSSINLRIDPPKNGNVKNIRWAKDFLIVR